MKIIRLGMTESGLLMLVYASKRFNFSKEIKSKINQSIIGLANWLYTTSGFYDKEVLGTKFDFGYNVLTKNFFNYIGHLKDSVKDCELAQFYFHDGFIRNLFEQIKDKFIEELSIKNFKLLNDTKFSDRIPTIYQHMKNKRILVISSFDELIKQQYDNGNVNKLGLNFPNINGLDVVKFPYCFLNNGPHKNYFETLESVFEEIKKKEFDIALLGCGAYGHMLTHKIHSELNKDAIYVGGTITNLFGILSSREMKYTDLKHNEFWITQIPDKYKPSNYKSIEDGCYW